MKLSLNRLQFIHKAFAATKQEMLVSLGIVLALTVILSIIFYIAESIAQPDVYRNYWDALVWAYTRYMEGGDGVFEGGPVTVTGKVIASLLGLIGIAVVAVPAGLVANGFMQAMEEEKKQREMEELSVTLHKFFRRSAQTNSWFYTEKNLKKCYKCVARTKKLVSLQIKLGLSMDRIMETINYCPDLRLANLASTQRKIDNPQDCLVVVNFPLNNEYGLLC